jgi:DNA-binding MarR family transcriptional regulator
MDRLPKEVATTVLLAVYRSGNMTMSKIQQQTKFSTITVLNHVNALIKSGLLVEERENVFPKRRVIKTTIEGTRIAGLLNVADRVSFSSPELIDIGAKAGRIAAYQEGLASVKKVNVSKEYLMAELLLRGVSALSGGLEAVAKGLPAEMVESKSQIQAWSDKLEGHYSEGLKRLGANDCNGCLGVVSKALTEFNSSSETLKATARALKELKLEEIANYVEFLSPKVSLKG